MKPTPAPLGAVYPYPLLQEQVRLLRLLLLPRSEDRMDDYTDALCAICGDRPLRIGPSGGHGVFRGGTPSYLGVKRLEKILKVILKKYKVAKDAEITLEANPDSAGDWKALRSLANAASTASPWGCSPLTTRSWRRSAGSTPWPR